MRCAIHAVVVGHGIVTMSQLLRAAHTASLHRLEETLANVKSAMERVIETLARQPPCRREPCVSTLPKYGARRRGDARGAGVIHQGALRNGEWFGRPDFLVKRVNGNETHWGHHYEVVDAKLGRTWDEMPVAQRLSTPKRTVSYDGSTDAERLADVSSVAV